jgi:hypothetical protein
LSLPIWLRTDEHLERISNVDWFGTERWGMQGRTPPSLRSSRVVESDVGREVTEEESITAVPAMPAIELSNFIVEIGGGVMYGKVKGRDGFERPSDCGRRWSPSLFYKCDNFLFGGMYGSHIFT